MQSKKGGKFYNTRVHNFFTVAHFDKRKKGYNSSIQIVRGVLFLFILAFHSGVPFAQFGWGGVESFFVISSFFLVQKYYGKHEYNLFSALKKRLLRLYPSYIFILIIAISYAVFKTTPFFLDFVIHLLASQNFYWMVTDYKSVLQPFTAHTWTLSIEVWLGVLWLVLLRYIIKKQNAVCFFMLLAIIGISYRTGSIYLGLNYLTVSLFPVAHMDAFACGSLLAVAVKEEVVKKKWLLVSGIIGLLGIMSCVWIISIFNSISLLKAYTLLQSSENYLNHWLTGNIYSFISLLSVSVIGLLYEYQYSYINQNKPLSLLAAIGNVSYELYL